MGASLPKRTASKRRRAPMGDINVTPLVDVMLVLLIIFMVTAPLMTVGIPVNLPKTKAPSINDSSEPLTITVQQNGEIYLQETPIDLETLVAKVQAIMTTKPETRIFLRGDQGLSYGRIMQIMGTLNAAGYHKIALLTELPASGKNAPSHR